MQKKKKGCPSDPRTARGDKCRVSKKKKASCQSDNLSVKRDWGIRSWKRKKERRWKGGDPRTLVVAEGTGSEN